MSLLFTDQSVSSVPGEGVFTTLAPAAGNILVDSGDTFTAGGRVQSLFKSVPANTAVNAGLDVGNAVLVAGTVTVADTAVTASTVLLMSRKTIGGTTGNLSYTLNAGVGFTINSSSSTDTSTVSYLRVN